MTIAPSGALVTTAVEMQLQAAIEGLGIIRSFEEFLAPALAGGILEPVLSDWEEDFSGPYLYYSSRRHMPAPLRAFVDFLQGPWGRW